MHSTSSDNGGHKCFLSFTHSNNTRGHNYTFDTKPHFARLEKMYVWNMRVDAHQVLTITLYQKRNK